MRNDLISKAGDSPPAGFHAIPGGRHAGFTNGKTGRSRRYWYPHGSDTDAAGAHHIAEGTRIANEHRGRSTPSGYPRDKDAKRQMEDHFHAGYSARDYENVRMGAKPKKKKKKLPAAAAARDEYGGGRSKAEHEAAVAHHTSEKAHYSELESGYDRTAGKRAMATTAAQQGMAHHHLMAHHKAAAAGDSKEAAYQMVRAKDFHNQARATVTGMEGDAFDADSVVGSFDDIRHTPAKKSPASPPAGGSTGGTLTADQLAARIAALAAKKSLGDPMHPELTGQFDEEAIAKGLESLAGPKQPMVGADGTEHAPPVHATPAERIVAPHFSSHGSALYFDRAPAAPSIVKSKRPDGQPRRPLDDQEWGHLWGDE